MGNSGTDDSPEGLRVMASMPIVRILFLVLGIVLTGCSRQSNPGGVAGRAYVEDEHGNLVPADSHISSGVSSGPLRSFERSEGWLTEFELTERSGRTVSSAELKGQPYVLSFFFTTCPTICKQQNAKVKMLQEKFRSKPIRFVSISCDPDVDNPEVLSIYAEEFGADPDQWLFLTGDLETIRRVGAEMYAIAVDRRFHAEKLLLVDADGNIYRTYDWPEEKAWQTLLEDIQKMLDSGGRLPAT